MSSVFSNLKPRPSVDRNGFDLSRRSVFSTKVGQILPVFCQSTLPNSEYKIDVKQLLRTQPLQTAAFSGFSINYDFFFVPNNNSYSSFNEFIAQKKDRNVVENTDFTKVPLINFKAFMSALLPACLWDYTVSSRFPVYNDGFEAHTCARFLFVFGNCPWQSVCLSCLRSLDMFGYGNYLPLLKRLYVEFWNNLERYNSSVRPSQTLTPFDLETFDGFYNCLKNYVSYIDEPLSPPAEFSEPNELHSGMKHIIEYLSNNDSFDYLAFPDVNVSLWPFMAYNRGFYSFYKNVFYEADNLNCWYNLPDEVRYEELNPPYVTLFNFDDWDVNYSLSGAFSDFQSARTLRILSMIGLKPHQYKKDLFTGTLPSTQYGNVSLMLDNRDWLKLMVQNDNSNAVAAHTPPVTQSAIGNKESSELMLQNSLGTYGSASFRFQPALAISVLESRRADAMQRFKERMLRAGNRTKDVFVAHGWEKPLSEKSYDPVFLGTFDGRLDINTVAATSPANGVELGQLGANGVGVVRGDIIRFKSHDFGVILGVMYIVKDAEYDAYGLEKQHCLTDPFDYPYPELQNISLAPIDTLEVSSYLHFNPSGNLFSGRILGYLPRFMEYKTALDKVHGEFYTSQIIAFDPSQIARGFENVPGVFSDWVTPREDINNPTSLGFLYQNPACADNVFLLSANECQETDQFLVNCYFDCMAVEPISVIGLPL